jgi:tRNA pseudouridine55 synthase
MFTQTLKPAVHGWVILDKPQGLTSTQALGKVRRLVDGKKAGHGGTLDPLATGILPLAFGEATKLIPYVMDGRKEYEFTIRWGEARDTEDAEGQVTATSDQRPSVEVIQLALSNFIGDITQTPPAYSAIKLDGQRAYDIARAGGAPEMQPRQVYIDDLKFVDQPDADHARFRVACGKGMYVRSLARDLAVKLDTYGHITALRRTRVGPFTFDHAISLEKLAELGHKGAAHTGLLAMQMALDDIPGLTLTASEAQSLRAGQELLIRPHQLHLMDAKLIFAEHQGVPVAMIEPFHGAFRVVRGFHF